MLIIRKCRHCKGVNILKNDNTTADIILFKKYYINIQYCRC